MDKFEEDLQLLNQVYQKKFSQRLKSTLEQILNYKTPELMIEINKKLWGNLTLSEIETRNSSLMKNLKVDITIFFEQQIESINEGFDRAIEFYNYLLEKQILYQQESIEQRETEKQWIDAQYQQLKTIQQSLEQILRYKRYKIDP